MSREVRSDGDQSRFVAVVIVLTAASIVFVGGLHLKFAARRFLALEAVLAVSLVTLVWLLRTEAKRSSSQNATWLVATQLSVASAVVVVDQWAIHLAPMGCIVAVLTASRFVSASRYRLLATACIVTILAISALARFYPTEVLHDIVGGQARDLIAVIYTPLMVMIIGWVSWVNHASLQEQRGLIAASRNRILLADNVARESLESRTTSLRNKLYDLRSTTTAGIGGDHVPTSAETGLLTTEIRYVASRIRAVSHGLVSPPSDLAPADALHFALAGLIDGVTITSSVDRLPQHLEIAVPRIVTGIAEALVATGGRLEGVDLVKVHDCVRLEIRSKGHAVIEPPDHVRDRIAALDGSISSSPNGSCEAIDLPWTDSTIEADGDEVAEQDEPAALASAMRTALWFPVVAFVVAAVMYLTYLPYSVTAVIASTILCAYTLPCAAAALLAKRRPRTGILVFTAAHWVTATLVISEFHILKFYSGIALTIPVILALPYLQRIWFGLVAAMSAATTVAVTVEARRFAESSVADKSPDLVNDILIVVLIGVSSAVVLALSQRNQARQLARSSELRLSRRSVVQQSDAARRVLERDLHDGVQQRLVTAAMRAQIASQLPDDGAGRRANLQIVAEELAGAIAALEAILRGVQPEPRVQDLRVALHRLGSSTAIPVVVDLDPLPEDLPTAIAAAIWYCCAESLSNTMKHAGPFASADVRLRSNNDHLELDIRDDGYGFDPATTGGAGLDNLTERVAGVGGQLEITAGVGQGVRLRGTIPMNNTT